jgi:hypothetical protein
MSKYMVCVVGASAPTVTHPTIGEAMREAERLSLLTPNIQRTVHVLKIECSLLPKINHVWQLEAAQPDVETKKEI